jgi:tRNA A37 methylthiotransferase MiaB
MQSLSDGVLQRMGRGQVRVDEIARRAHALRAARPHCALGGDFIVGFPGETPEMFAETMANVAYIGFACGHVFRYSPRPGTPASAMPGRASATDARDRSRALRDLLGEQRRTFIDSMRNRAVRILVEQEEPAAGLTSNYIRVAVPRHRAPKNSWLTVRITGFDGHTNLCTGEVYG